MTTSQRRSHLLILKDTKILCGRQCFSCSLLHFAHGLCKWITEDSWAENNPCPQLSPIGRFACKSGHHPHRSCHHTCGRHQWYTAAIGEKWYLFVGNQMRDIAFTAAWKEVYYHANCGSQSTSLAWWCHLWVLASLDEMSRLQGQPLHGGYRQICDSKHFRIH